MYIPLSVPNLSGNELKYVTEAITTEWVSTGGSFINDFEKNIVDYINSEGAVACQSGTAGIHLSLVANNIGANDLVIAPCLTFVAAINPIKYVGASPVFMDCDETLCIDMDKVERFILKECTFDGEKLTHNATKKQIKAMIMVHVFGNIGNIEKALELKEKYNLILIEDATEALGSYITDGKLKGKFAGTIGDVGVYSFNGNKIITTGGGGMVVSNNRKMLEKIKYLSTQAKDDMLYYIHNEIGYNYRMTNLQAALGLGQMEQLEDFIKTKEENYREYEKQGIELLKFRNDIRPNYWFYSYITEQRDELIQYLEENKIQSRPIWNLICDLKPYKSDVRFEIEKAYYFWNKVLNIPCSSNLTKEMLERVAVNILESENV